MSVTKDHEKLTLYPQGQCLLEALVRSLPCDLAADYGKVAVVLPTQRLAVHLLKMLGQKYPRGFFPPQIFSLEQFVGHVLEKNSSEAPQVISPVVSELILGSLIKESSYQYLKVGQEHEIHQFFMEELFCF